MVQSKGGLVVQFRRTGSVVYKKDWWWSLRGLVV